MNTLKALGRLPQRVIVKMPNISCIDIPENVMIVRTIPIKEVLAHPNVKVSMSLIH
jgi:UDP:flavonoid glycosyltransferase YjiC (YdhE family)